MLSFRSPESTPHVKTAIAALALAGCAAAGACSGARAGLPQPVHSGPLISSRTTMVTAWQFPKNPLTDPTLDDSRLSNDIRWGFRIFTNTRGEVPQYTPGRVSCNNCHLNGGQREKSLPLVGVVGMFPEYNRRSGRFFTLNDRIVDCFLRSQNATGASVGRSGSPVADVEGGSGGCCVFDVAVEGIRGRQQSSWRGQNAIPPASLIPIAKLDPARGEAIFQDRCTTCHGPDGQGVFVGDKRPGPLWGPDSWNDGAGAARVYTLAGIIRYSMPYLSPGSLTDEEAQQLAAFINSKPRPAYPFKANDYRTEKIPVDSVYYTDRSN